jgi:hypothetical protein
MVPLPANQMEDSYMNTKIETNQSVLSDAELNEVAGGSFFRLWVYSPGSLGTLASLTSNIAHGVGSVISHFKFW